MRCLTPKINLGSTGQVYPLLLLLQLSCVVIPGYRQSLHALQTLLEFWQELIKNGRRVSQLKWLQGLARFLGGMPSVSCEVGKLLEMDEL